MLNLVPRPNSPITGSEFIKDNYSNSIVERERNVLSALLEGNIPDFLLNMSEVHATDGLNSITYLVFSDALSIGTNEDYLRMPMNPLTAQQICNAYDCTMPTKKMCDQIWKAAINKLEPRPKGPPYDNSMLSMEQYAKHNFVINSQLTNKDPFVLTSGHKKDVIIDKALLLKKNKVCIYGWFKLDGTAIQGPMPNSSSHDDLYQDYSHGIRLICNDVMVNNSPMRFKDVLNDEKLNKLISDQGKYDCSQIYI